MDIGIGLPSTSPGADGATVLDWARKAEDAGFSTLGTLDRLLDGNFDPITALAAAAAVTSRIRPTSAIILATYRGTGRCWASSSPASTSCPAGG